jgi:hypothetical protein
MNAADRQTFRLVHKNARALALYAVSQAPEGYVVTVKPLTRSLDQNAKLHSLLADIARSGIEIGGCRRTVDELKFLFVVAHAHETNTPVELVEFEGHQIALRESTANMSKARSSSLIEYIQAWATQHGLDLTQHGVTKDGEKT